MKGNVSMRSVFLLVIAPFALCAGEDYSNSSLLSCPWAGEDKTICEGGVGVVIGTVSNEFECSNEDYCFVWFPQEGLDNPYSLNPVATPISTETYTIFVTDDSGDLIAEDEVTISVDPIVDMRLDARFESMCDGGSNLLSIIGVTEDSYSFLWNTGENTPSIDISNPGYYEVTVSSQSGCEVMFSTTIEEEELSVNIGSSSTSFCAGNPLTLEVLTNVSGEGRLLYNWSSSEDLREITIDRAGFYSVTVVDSYTGCEVVSSIDILAAVDLQVTPNPAILCGPEPGSVILGTIDTYQSYQWSKTGTVISTEQTLEVAYNGVYHLEVTDENGCTASATIPVYQSEASDLTINGSGSGICVQDPGLVSPRSSNESCSSVIDLSAEQNYVTYQWSTGDNTSLISVSSVGVYSLTVTDEFGCSGSAEYEVNPCVATALSIEPGELLAMCDDETPLVLKANEDYVSYSWSTGDISSGISVNQAGSYSLTVTDAGGCTVEQNITVMPPIDSDVELDLELYRPVAQSGTENSLIVEEQTIGGMLFVNANNNDQDSRIDIDDREIIVDGGAGDPDLLRVRLKLIPGSSGTVPPVKLLAESIGGEDLGIEAWESSDKTEGKFNLGEQVILSEFDGTYYYKDIWLEGISPHSIQRNTKLRFICNENPECETPVAEAFITVVGVANLTWNGSVDNNGFDANFLTSPNLDIDPLFPTGESNSDGSSLTSVRVFPGARAPGNDNVVEVSPRDRVALEVNLSVAPVENVVLYFRLFDVDDPASETTFIDPNDDGSNCCNPGITKPYKGGVPGVTYDLNNDNRGKVNGRSEGEIIGQDADGIVSRTLTAGQQNIDVTVRVSHHPGDNYRAAVSFDRGYLMRVENIDAKDGFDLVDGNTSNRKSIYNAGNYASPILTVWRILHVEHDEMMNYTYDQNEKNGYINDFQGKKGLFSQLKELTEIAFPYEPTNPSTLFFKRVFDHPLLPLNFEDFSDMRDPDSQGQYWRTRGAGRFENGQIRIGSSESVIINAIKANGNNRVILPNQTLSLAIPFTIEISGGPITEEWVGTISDIQKVGTSFQYEIASLNGHNFADIPDGAFLRIDGGEKALIANLIDSPQSQKIETNTFNIPFRIRDDDAAPSTGSLPRNYDISGLDVFLDARILPVNDGGGSTLNNATEVPFLQNITTVGILENHFSGHIQSMVSESDNYWVVYFCSAWQGGTPKDDDPDTEFLDYSDANSTTLGQTNSGGQTSNVKHLVGGNISVIYYETMREAGTNVLNLQDKNIGHETGHQFGLSHAKPDNDCGEAELVEDVGIMSFNILGSNGQFTPRHLNLIRIRINSPGQ